MIVPDIRHDFSDISTLFESPFFSFLFLSKMTVITVCCRGCLEIAHLFADQRYELMWVGQRGNPVGN
jgi:uncharacterized membrane protein HdeD (DUF308 family)